MEVSVVSVPLDSNVIGKALLEDIHSKNGSLLMKAGVVLTKSLIERLQKNNIVKVHVAE
jgi:hypothetical protein